MAAQSASEPTGPYVPPEHAQARHRSTRFPAKAALPAIGVVAGVFALAGVVAGVVWSRLGLRGGPIEAIMYNGRPAFADEVTAARLFEMDGSFAAIGAITGLLLGAVLYPIFRRHGPWTVGALVVGGVLGAVISFAVGTVAANDELILAWNPTAEHGATLSVPLTLHAYGVAVAWPLSALISVLVLGWLWRPETSAPSGADRVIHTSDHPGVGAGDDVR